jgi:hypothetical protein
MKSTPEMPRVYMVFTALEPPPPTPITLMGAFRFTSEGLDENVSFMVFLLW